MIESGLTVNTTHLLGQHDGGSSEGTSSDTGDGEELRESRNVGFTLDHLVLFGELDVGVVHIPGSNDLAVSQLLERDERLLVSTLLHEPSGGLWAKEDQNGEWNGGDKCGSELETPCDISNVFDNGIGADSSVEVHRYGQPDSRESKEDTESGPKLPTHDEGSSNLVSIAPDSDGK